MPKELMDKYERRRCKVNGYLPNPAVKPLALAMGI